MFHAGFHDNKVETEGKAKGGKWNINLFTVKKGPDTFSYPLYKHNANQQYILPRGIKKYMTKIYLSALFFLGDVFKYFLN